MPVYSRIVRRRRLRKRTRRSFLHLWLFVFAALFAVLALSFFRYFRPVLCELAIAKADNAVSVAINNAISEKLAEGDIRYDRIVLLEKNESGMVTAVMTDMAKVNLLKAQITSEIIRALSDDVTADISIPMGNITGISLMSGKGPNIPVEIVAVTRANTEFVNRFSSAGINQTRHQILVQVNTAVSVLLPGGNLRSEVSTEVTVAETVIIGNVPESYTYFEADEKWDESLEQFDLTT